MSRTRLSTSVDLRCAVDLRGVQANAARRVPSPAVLHWIYPAHPPVPIAITRRAWRRPSTHGCDGQTDEGHGLMRPGAGAPESRRRYWWTRSRCPGRMSPQCPRLHGPRGSQPCRCGPDDQEARRSAACDQDIEPDGRDAWWAIHGSGTCGCVSHHVRPNADHLTASATVGIRDTTSTTGLQMSRHLTVSHRVVPVRGDAYSCGTAGPAIITNRSYPIWP